MKAKLKLSDKLLILLYTLPALILLISECSCRTPSIETTYKAKCVASENDVSQFEYYYNCHKLKPCAIQFEAIGEYEVGKYYTIKYIQK